MIKLSYALQNTNFGCCSFFLIGFSVGFQITTTTTTPVIIIHDNYCYHDV